MLETIMTYILMIKNNFVVVVQFRKISVSILKKHGNYQNIALNERAGIGHPFAKSICLARHLVWLAQAH